MRNEYHKASRSDIKPSAKGNLKTLKPARKQRKGVALENCGHTNSVNNILAKSSWGGDLGETGWTVSPKFEVGDGYAYVPSNISETHYRNM